MKTMRTLSWAIATFAFSFASTMVYSAPDKVMVANSVNVMFTNFTSSKMEVWTFDDYEECRHKSSSIWIDGLQTKTIEVKADQKVSIYAGQTDYVQGGLSICSIVVTFDTTSGNKYVARYARYGTGCKIGVAAEKIGNDDPSKIVPVKLLRRRYESPWYGGGAICKKFGPTEQQLTEDEQENLFKD